ncbi:hypothetical protein D3C73_1637170 [compost metagenome]
MCIAGQYQAGGAYRASGAAHVHRAAMDQFQHRALLEDPHAKGLCQLCFAKHQVQRVQVARAHVNQPAGIDV